MAANGFPDPPEAAVTRGSFELGRFNAPFPRANMLDVARPYHYAVPRFVKNLRLKEWQAFQFGDERWFFFSALYNAKLMSLAIFHAYDRKTRRRHSIQRVIPGSAFPFGERLSGSRLSYRGARSRLEYACLLDEGAIEVRASRSHRDAARAFEGSFRFSYGPKACAPSAACLPLGLNRAMYSMKTLMPLTGEFQAGGETFRLDPPGAMGVIDEHKGFYPWQMRYDWVTGFGLDAKGRRVGFNLTSNQVRDQARYNENCLWINNKVWPLPPVRVTRPRGPEGEWIVQDTEGMVDLVFVPEARNDVRFNLGFAKSDYHGPFGSFRGVLKNGEGEKIEAERLYGAGEQKDLRL